MIFDELLISCQNKVITYQTMLNSLENNPEIILNLFQGGEDNLLTFIFKNSSQFTMNKFSILDLQEYLFVKLYPLLNEIFDEYEFEYDKEVYPSFLYMTFKNKAIVKIDIFNKKVYLLEDEYISNLKENINKTNNEVNKLKKKIDFLTDCSENVELLKNSDFLDELNTRKKTFVCNRSIQNIDIVLRKKKYRKKILDYFKKISNEAMQLEKSLNKDNLKLDKLWNENKEVLFRQEKIGKYFNDKYNYAIIQNCHT